MISRNNVSQRKPLIVLLRLNQLIDSNELFILKCAQSQDTSIVNYLQGCFYLIVFLENLNSNVIWHYLRRTYIFSQNCSKHSDSAPHLIIEINPIFQ